MLGDYERKVYAEMAPEERQALRAIGRAVLGNVIIIQTTVCLCYGILAPIPVMVAYSFANHWSKSWLTRLQFVVALLSVIVYSGFIAIHTLTTIYECQLFRKSFTTLPEHERTFNALAARVSVVEQWLEFIPPIINDSFIIWRAWVVFERRSWARYLSLGLCFSTFVITLVFLSMDSNPNVLLAAEKANSATLHFPLMAATISSFVTNLVATSFIGWTLRSHIQFLQRNTDEKLRRYFKLQRILYLLVDSGAVYAVLQLLQIVMSLATSPDQDAATIAFNVVGNVYFSISIIYPILTIFLIRSPLSVASVHGTVQSLQIYSLRP